MKLTIGVEAQVELARAVLVRQLGESLRAIHLFGSAVDGGVKPWSDIDLLVTVNERLEEPVRKALMLELMSISAPPGTSGKLRALEVTVVVYGEVVPWRYPPVRELQFGEWLRKDLELARMEARRRDADLAVMFTKLRLKSVPILGPEVSILFDPVPKADFETALISCRAGWRGPEDWREDERNVILTMARVRYSLETGLIAPKEVAAEWLIARVPDALAGLVADARDAYLGLREIDFSGREDEIAALMREG